METLEKRNTIIGACVNGKPTIVWTKHSSD